MKKITQEEMLRKLVPVMNAKPMVFVSYLASKEPTLRAKLEAAKSEHEGYNRRTFTGTLVNVWITQKGEAVFSVFVEERYNLDDLKAKGHFRTFSPARGTLLELEVL